MRQNTNLKFIWIMLYHNSAICYVQLLTDYHCPTFSTWEETLREKVLISS